uniref:Envelope fusion protein n=1 Tax=Trichogramma kaykai TaxID=54128 RepID=A0ABD2VUI4_9HYME
MSEVQLIEATKTVENLRLTFNQHSSDRHKRSLAPVIGRVANLLFGTLDDLAEERIMGLIETSINDTRKLAELLANQTEIVDKRLQYTEEEMRTLKKNVESALDERWNYLDLIDTLTSQIVYARMDAGILTEAILFARQGILHPQLIPSTLINSTSDLIKIVKTNPNIEADLEYVYDLLKIAKITILYEKPVLIYYISTPLTNKQRYKLMKFTAVPYPLSDNTTQQKFSYIWPDSKYILISDDNTSYKQITEIQLQKCKKLRDYHICMQNSPTQTITGSSPCEIQLATGKSTNLENFCDIKTMILTNTFWAALIESEKQRKLNRFQNHFRNRVWNKRSNAPENWNSQLPLWWREKNKNNYFSCKSRQIKDGSLNDIDLEIYNACTIL